MGTRENKRWRPRDAVVAFRAMGRRAAVVLLVAVSVWVAGAVCAACSSGDDASAAPSDSPHGHPGDVLFSQTLHPFCESGAGSLGYRIDVAPSGHVVVACSVRDYRSAATISLTPSGTDWQFLRDRADEDAAQLVWSDQAVADDGSVVDVGFRADNSTFGYSLVVSRFVDADTRFDTTYQEEGHELLAAAVAIGDDGAIYVVGDCQSSPDTVLVKYDQTLKPVWVRHYGGLMNNWGRAVAVEGDSVYVAGEGYRRRGLDLDLLVARYDAETGRRVWVRHVATGDRRDQRFSGLVVRSSGVYVCGMAISARHRTPQGVRAKISLSGVQRWVRFSSATWWNDIGAAPDGSLRLTGTFYRRRADRDMVTAAYRRDGTRLWRRVYAGPGDSLDEGSDLDVDAAGTTYVGGASGISSADRETDLLMSAYDRTGKRLWVTTWPGINVDGLYYGVMDLEATDDSVWVTGTSVDHDVLVLQLQK